MTEQNGHHVVLVSLYLFSITLHPTCLLGLPSFREKGLHTASPTLVTKENDLINFIPLSLGASLVAQW